MSTAVLRQWSACKNYLTSAPLCRYRLYQQLRFKLNEPKIVCNMNEAFLRYERGSETFHVTLRYANGELNLDRQFNFSRSASESVSNFLKRVDVNINKCLVKKKSRKKKRDSAPAAAIEKLSISLMRNDAVVDGEASCETVFENTERLVLMIDDAAYVVKHNAPWIVHMALPSSILAGYPTYPAKFESLYTEKADSTFAWYRSDRADGSKSMNWEEVGSGYFYVPGNDDIGRKLKLVCVPGKNGTTGPSVEVESTSTVGAGPDRCPFETRHSFTADKLSGDSFRVTSYNILADTYTDSDYSRDVLFPYCPRYALEIDYRKQLILKELIGYNADIICLQEVDNKIYDADLKEVLGTLKYGSEFNRKGRDVTEGLATFFNEERFDKLRFEHSIIGENVELDKFYPIWCKIDNVKLKERFLERNTAVQVTTLRSKENPSEILIVGNTHLYFRPDADHIRLLQGYYVLTYIQQIVTRTREESPGCNVSIVLCGDFNSVPDNGIYRLMTKRSIPEDYKDWNSNPEEAVKNVSLAHDLSIGSACGTPPYTNYTPLFAGCLDYIFYQTDKLDVVQVIPMPSLEELTTYSGLPSVVFPSDHISLCADLKWKT